MPADFEKKKKKEKDFNEKGGLAVPIVLDAVNVLRKLNLAGWVHGDIRRSNILMREGHGVLIDYAYTRHFDDLGSLDAAVRQEMTRLALVLRYWCTAAHFVAIALQSRFVQDGVDGVKATDAYAAFISALLPLLPTLDRSPKYFTQVLANRSPTRA